MDLGKAEDRKFSWEATIIILEKDNGRSHQGCDNVKEADVIVQRSLLKLYK